MSTAMDETQYLESRIDDQIGWYERSCRYNKMWFQLLSVVGFIAAAFIPFLTPLIKQYPLQYLPLIVGLLGVTVSVTSAVLGLYKFHEHWVQYRITSEMLKHEKYLYLTGSPPYNEEQPFNTFVERVEGLISRENATWIQYVTPEKKKE